METQVESGPRRRVRLRVPLKVKLSFLITALVVLAVVLVGAFLLRQAQQTLTAEMTKRGLTIAEHLAAGAKSAMLSNDDLTLNLLVKDAMKDPDVAYVVIADDDGTVRAHSDLALLGQTVARPAGLEPLARPARWCARTARAPRSGSSTSRIPSSSATSGWARLYLGFSERSITAALARARNQTILITVVMVLVGIGGAVALATVLVAPDLPARARHARHRRRQLPGGAAR